MVLTWLVLACIGRELSELQTDGQPASLARFVFEGG